MVSRYPGGKDVCDVYIIIVHLAVCMGFPMFTLVILTSTIGVTLQLLYLPVIFVCNFRYPGGKYVCDVYVE